MTLSYETLKKKWLQDPDFKKEYDALKPEFEIARVLIEARFKSHLSQKQVAEKMKTTQSVIARLESGQQNVSINTLRRYAKAVGRNIKIEITPLAS